MRVFSTAAAAAASVVSFAACELIGQDDHGSSDDGSDVSAEATTCKAPAPVFHRVDPITGKTCRASRCTPGFCARADITALGAAKDAIALQDRLATLDCSPHSVAPLEIAGAAEQPSRLFAYYLLDSTSFEPSVFTTVIPGVNDLVQRTVFGANCDLPTIGAVRLAIVPGPGRPASPGDPRASIDIFTDLRGLFAIHNESGWYEGWMIHTVRVAEIAPADGNGRAPFGKITEADAKLLKAMGTGNNVPLALFTVDGRAPHFPMPTDRFPDSVSNVVTVDLSMGAFNALQQADAHGYRALDPTTNWVHPLYELPFTGGFPSHRGTDPATSYQDGLLGAMQSFVPGNAPASNNRSPELARLFGDSPFLPRDPDKLAGVNGVDTQREFRQRGVPSGIALEAYLNAFQRLASFEPRVTDLTQRLLDGYQAAIATVDTDRNGIISAVEGDIDTPNPNCPQGDNTCIYLAADRYERFAVTREIDDGLLAPRFANSTRAWVLSGKLVIGFTPFAVTGAPGGDG
ncbi:MAG: hypothetical protein KIT31_23550 [Deltaproteobacteria bacterium]|nr:hypothetical protein [Deltaproteobacteria bacterium]